MNVRLAGKVRTGSLLARGPSAASCLVCDKNAREMITLLAMMIASIIWEAEGGYQEAESSCMEAESSCVEADGTYLEAADNVLAECVMGLRWQQGGRAVHLQAGRMQVCWSPGIILCVQHMVLRVGEMHECTQACALA